MCMNNVLDFLEKNGFDIVALYANYDVDDEFNEYLINRLIEKLEKRGYKGSVYSLKKALFDDGGFVVNADSGHVIISEFNDTVEGKLYSYDFFEFTLTREQVAEKLKSYLGRDDMKGYTEKSIQNYMSNLFGFECLFDIYDYDAEFFDDFKDYENVLDWEDIWNIIEK